MALTDYRKLCPNSGHALTDEDRGSLAPARAGATRARSARCAACGRTVDVRPDPGTGTSLLYAIHLRAGDPVTANGEGLA
jgi:hypothetical protein